MSSNAIDLLTLFSSVQGTLEKNQKSLNKADDRNGDHGDNMVKIFNLATAALQEMPGDSHSAQLGHVAEKLSDYQSGSAQLYAKGFERAATEFSGKSIDAASGLQLIQTIMGAGQAPAAPAENPLGSLLGGLLGAAGGSSSSSASEEGGGLFDAEDLLRGGMAYFTAKQSGKDTKEAMIQALLAASPFGETQHRAQSSQLVASTLLDVLGSMAGK